MKTSESIDKIAQALCKAQAEMLPLIKDSSNPFFKSKYADLQAVTAACYPALQANGIAVIQSNLREDGALVVLTRLLHASAQWIETTCVVPAKAQDAQAYGSAYTYGRRYGLQAAVGLAPEDDDGHAATAPKKASNPTQAPVKKVEPKQPTASEKAEALAAKSAALDWHAVQWPFAKPEKYAGQPLAVVAAAGDVEALGKLKAYYFGLLGEKTPHLSKLVAKIDSALLEASAVAAL
jgi:hypothetical protein